MVRSLVRVVAAASLALAVAAPAASAHQGNPNFRSYVDGVTPRVSGLSLQVLNFDDRLELTNRSGRTVVVQGYNDDPYVRILADGTVQVNRRSPAVYLNEDRLGAAPVPSSADPKAAPLWRTVDRTSRRPRRRTSRSSRRRRPPAPSPWRAFASPTRRTRRTP